MGRAAPDVPDSMRGIHGRFTRWRKSHTGRLPIPQPLWAAAAEVARRHGVFRTSKVLSLEYGKLKRLTTESHPAGRRTAKLSAPPAAFVELLAPGTGGGAECVIELEGPRGKMRIQWKGSATPDLASLRRSCFAAGNPEAEAAPVCKKISFTSEKYDETAAAMIAQLRYGSGLPFKRLERLEGNLGIPLPAATQWGIAEKAALKLGPAYDEFIRQAALGEVMHSDDTGMRILKLAREPADPRTGIFTSGIVSLGPGWKIALYFSGAKHAGENLAELLKRRPAGLAPLIQMCDARSWNTSHLPEGVERLLAHCMSHGSCQFVEVAGNFPEECRYVLETLGGIWNHDALARKQELSPEERLRFHQEHSGPLMKTLHDWMEAQLAERKTEPNSGLGKAIRYMLRHWLPLTLFLRQAGAPIDNNLVERILKKAILHRKNSLFYKTLNGARVGDLFMSLIHTCELNRANPFDYLTELQRHAEELKRNPSEWMPWNYRETLARLARAAVA